MSNFDDQYIHECDLSDMLDKYYKINYVDISDKINESIDKMKDISKQDTIGIILSNILNGDECGKFIRTTEDIGFEELPIYSKTCRSNKQIIIDDTNLACELFYRIHEWLPRYINNENDIWSPSGINSKIKFLRYDNEDSFDKHHDDIYKKSSNEKSLLSLIIYLNDINSKECGGCTKFVKSNGSSIFNVEPKTGLGLIYEQKYIMHEGEMLKDATKYILRADILYKISPKLPNLIEKNKMNSIKRYEDNFNRQMFNDRIDETTNNNKRISSSRNKRRYRRNPRQHDRHNYNDSFKFMPT